MQTASQPAVKAAFIPTRADLSEDQLSVYDMLEAWALSGSKRPVQDLTLGGYAGTGKTTLVSLLGHRMQAAGLRVAYVAFTGKASNVMRRKLTANGVHPSYCGTIHGLLYQPETDEKTGRVLGWNKVEDLSHLDLLVIDEASMVNEEIYRDLQSYGLPILAVGDHGQLPPVEGRFNLMERPMLRLDKIHRQAEGNPILALSAFIRQHGGLPRGFENTPQLQMLYSGALPTLVREAFVTCVSPWSVGLLTYTNATRQALNARVRSCLAFSNSRRPEGDETLICLRNMRSFGKGFGEPIWNGQRCIVRGIREHGDHHLVAKLEFPEEKFTQEGMVCKYQFGQPQTFNDFSVLREDYGFEAKNWDDVGALFDFGYAMTVHKSQGDQWPHVIVAAERPGRVTADEYRRWIYTAATRAAERLQILIGPGVPLVSA